MYVYVHMGKKGEFSSWSTDESLLTLRLRLFKKVYEFVKFTKIYLVYVYVYLQKNTRVYEFVKFTKVYQVYVYVYLRKILFSLRKRKR